MQKQQWGKGRAFAMDPQKRRRRLPLAENIVLEKPRRGALVVGLARDIVVHRSVWWRQPFLKILLQLAPCVNK